MTLAGRLAFLLSDLAGHETTHCAATVAYTLEQSLSCRIIETILSSFLTLLAMSRCSNALDFLSILDIFTFTLIFLHF